MGTFFFFPKVFAKVMGLKCYAIGLSSCISCLQGREPSCESLGHLGFLFIHFLLDHLFIYLLFIGKIFWERFLYTANES